ncbi:MAG: hypothetical protein A2506_12665 [Elusimicrobia bacterium RIFOXYD12_FULL_66_9]|nr:MAG: hypothetical protein A2506_12665 [Elusimicrobia bacterium RIFOXYD12_FULL_66_9]
MRRLPLVLALLSVCLGPAAAEKSQPPFEVVFENGVDISSASKMLRLFRTLGGEYPALVSAQIVRKVIFASPDRALGNVRYCWNPDGGVSRTGDDCGGEHLAVLIDLDTVFSFEDKFDDFYRKGQAVEAIIFHELLHGWAYEVGSISPHSGQSRLTRTA